MAVNPSLDATGLHVLRTSDVLANLQESVLASDRFGPETPVGEDSIVGQILAPVAQQQGLCYELLQSVYDSGDRDAAEGVVLDSIAAGMGMTREPATASTVRLILYNSTGAPGLLTAGHRAQIPDGAIFATDDDVTIPAGGNVLAWATCTVTGPVEAGPATVTVVMDSEAFWTSVSNASSTSAVLGSDEETDAALRLRMRTSGSVGGRCTVPSLQAALNALAFIDQAVVLTNRTDAVDVNGLPAHSFRALVWPITLTATEEEEVAAVIWEHLPDGIYSDGTEEYTVTNAEGISDEVRFSYLSEVAIFIHAHLTEDTDPSAPAYPIDGDALAAAAIVEYGLTLTGGKDVLPAKASGYLMSGYTSAAGVHVDGIPGIRSLIMEMKAGGTPSGSDIVPITVAATQHATILIANVTVTSA